MGNIVPKWFGGGGGGYEPQSAGFQFPPDAGAVAGGVAALSLDLLEFSVTSQVIPNLGGVCVQVPEGVSQHVRSSKQEQAIWYKKILEAWRTYQPPKTAKEARKLIVIALRENQPADIQSLLAYYDLPFPSTYDVSSLSIPSSFPLPPSPLPEGVQFVLRTLPVCAKNVGDGDGFSGYVKPEELPIDIQEAVVQMKRAQNAGKHSEAKETKKCLHDQGYRFIINSDREKILVRKYRFRLRGIDAPEIGMPYADEATAALRKLVDGKCLKISVYCTDRYGRYVGDVHCDGVFAQEQMLKQGLAWHYVAFDTREELAKWEKEARNARRGLWVMPNPEAPWDWKRKKPNCRDRERSLTGGLPPETGGLAAGVSALTRDLLEFSVTSQVPEVLSRHVHSSKQEQAIWYEKILEAWRTYEPPKTAKEVAELIVKALRKNHPADVQSLLAYYGLPFPSTYDVSSLSILSSFPLPLSPLPEGVQFVLRTLPVYAKDVVDGDGFMAYVKPEELPLDIRIAAVLVKMAQILGKRREIKETKKYLHDQGYQFITNSDGEKIVTREYRIRLRGIDAPEIGMPYARKARAALCKLVDGKCLKVSVYNTDPYDRYVGDVHCDGVFVQEQMLKQGLAWHSVAFDKREEFAKWEKEARGARRGLWVLPNPEAPWDWKSNFKLAEGESHNDGGPRRRSTRARKRPARPTVRSAFCVKSKGDLRQPF